MAYIGNTLRTAQPNYQIIDDISASFDGSTTTFALQVGGATPVPFPVSAQHCLISVGGVIQQPDPTGTDGFLLSGSNIVFSAAPSFGEDFFGVVLAGADYINVGAEFPDGSVANPSITFDQDTDTGLYRKGANNIAITTNGTERVSIDSGGRLLVGTSSVPVSSTAVLQGRSGATTGEAILRLCRGQETPADAATLGDLSFGDSNNGDAARIFAQRDGGTWTSGSSRPTRLVFSTAADGASSPTERMRIKSDGSLNVSPNGSYVTHSPAFHQITSTASNKDSLYLVQTNTSFGNETLRVSNYRTASSSFSFITCTTGNLSDDEFRLRGDGNAFADGSWNGGGADYAEYFEWSDGNTATEDRRGISVVLDGDKIREAIAGEEPIGVISGNPSVVGDTAWNKWDGKYLRDEFGTYIQEDYEVEDDNGNTVVQQRRKLNPDYDPNVEYIPRKDRSEWDCVGLMGKLRIRKGQITGSRWIKMRDISDTVEEWLVR